MDAKMATQLTRNCQDLRAAYVDSLKVYASSPKKFQKEIDAALKGRSAAYRAILLSALYHDSHFIPALEARAKTESSQKVESRFASAALERIRKGHCSDDYRDRRYDEVCRLGSPVVSRMIELTVKGAK